MYASKDYTNIYEFLKDEFDEALLDLEEDTMIIYGLNQ